MAPRFSRRFPPSASQHQVGAGAVAPGGKAVPPGMSDPRETLRGMGWGTAEHEGFADERRADGSWSGGTIRSGAPDAVACQAVCSCGWRSEREHFDPLLGYEPHMQLIEAADGGGRRHFLDGRPVHAGATLELLMPDEQWLRGRYEWSYAGGEPPTFYIVLGGPAEAQRQDVVPDVSFALPPRACCAGPRCALDARRAGATVGRGGRRAGPAAHAWAAAGRRAGPDRPRGLTAGD
jgi:hypothetical protein